MNTSKKGLSGGMKGLIVLGVVVSVLLLFCGFGCSSYNGMVELDEEVNKAWSNVETQYQRRADLVPQLVNTVKGYASHEQATLQGVTDARTGNVAAEEAACATLSDAYSATQESGSSFAQQTAAQDNLQRQLGLYINAVHEAYPQLRANENFADLQAQLEGTENRISTERTRYNAVVAEYNKTIRRFPKNIFAGLFGFEQRESFEAAEGAEIAPKVEF